MFNSMIIGFKITYVIVNKYIGICATIINYVYIKVGIKISNFYTAVQNSKYIRLI